ncbi:UbiA-like protein EboC [Fulvivirgaceae bacterium PWU4]|uniref:UbiA-like protein EboC n=1 Tax=Chryseosolibacter histidini TaxID=2782349 RepID=A0AAP2DR81_9BACT|nr:UbiA-like protein EboC [Chryseosolibacter histidini]
MIGFLRLTRPANIVTAISDILGGAAIAWYTGGTHELPSVLLLIVATIGLYGGGVVFNDFFDAALDRVERPERPIPSGLIREKEAALLGTFLLIVGIVAAAAVAVYPSGVIALAIAIAALVYDKWSKHHRVAGPLNMGLCRGLNLLLGMSLVPFALEEFRALAVVPVLYIAAITLISQGEVHGGKSKTMLIAAFLYLVVIASILYSSVLLGNVVYASGFLLILVLLIFPPLLKAFREPVGKNIGKAVKAGVIALIVMNAAWAATFGAFYLALGIVLLLPVSIFLARLFAVT